jgi:hypothetical protein
MSIKYIIIDKTGTIQEVFMKKFIEEDILKKCGFRKTDGFSCIYIWKNILFNSVKYNIQLWGKERGKNNTQNIYIFPSPIINNHVIYGKCALLCSSNNDDNNYIDLTKNIWINLHNILCDNINNAIDDADEADDEIDEIDEIDDYNIDSSSDLSIINKEVKLKKIEYKKLSDHTNNSNDDNSSIGSDADECLLNNINDNESDPIIIINDLYKNTNIDDISIGIELEEELYSYSDDD